MTKDVYLGVRGQLNFKVSSGFWLVHLLGDLVMLGAAGGLAFYGGLAGGLLASVVLASILFRAFGVMHEAVHGLLHPHKAINDWLGLLWGSICFLPYAQWREGHLQHHYWAGNLEKDPVMKLPLYIKSGGRLGLAAEAAWKTWLPVLAVLQNVVFWTNCVQLVMTKKMKLLERVSVVAPLVLWTTFIYIAGWSTLLLILAGAVINYLILVEIVNFPHHLELPTHVGETRVAVMDQHTISRSCTYFRWLERAVLMNFNYHVEHHLYPTLPARELRLAHGLVKAAISDIYNEEPGFSWVLRNRKKSLANVLYMPNAGPDRERPAA